MSTDASQSQLVGIVIGAILGFVGAIVVTLLQYKLTVRRDKQRDSDARRKRQEATYRRLKGLADKVSWTPKVTFEEGEFAKATFVPGKPVKTISMQDLGIIDSIMAQNFDVLDTETVAAWDTRKIIEANGLMANVQLDAFLDDVNEHYDRFKHTEVLPHTD
jgi:cellobiose-specific phosphotransferase system component IIB